MKKSFKFILLIAILIAMNISTLSFAASDSNKSAKDYLEGIWMVDKPPSTPECIDGLDDSTQMEFEFRRTGGRVLVYEPFDLFYYGFIASIKRGNDEITFEIISQHSPDKFSLHLLSNDKMEMHHLNAKPDEISEHKNTSILYRCGKADNAVNSSVSIEQLQMLTPIKPETAEFVEDSSEISNVDDCSSSKNKVNKKSENWLRFEVFGPVHYYIMGMLNDEVWDKKTELTQIHSIISIDKNTLQLEILERLPGGKGLWGSETQVQPYKLTIVRKGDYFFIPEMKKCFVRRPPLQ